MHLCISYYMQVCKHACLKQVRRLRDYDWCRGVMLRTLAVGAHVEARYRHKDGGKQWFTGVIRAVHAAQVCV